MTMSINRNNHRSWWPMWLHSIRSVVILQIWTPMCAVEMDFVTEEAACAMMVMEEMSVNISARTDVAMELVLAMTCANAMTAISESIVTIY